VRVNNALNVLSMDFPPMEITSAGVLKAKQPLHEPLTRYFSGARLIIDPSDKTSLDAVSVSGAYLITSHDVQWRAGETEMRLPLTYLVRLAQSIGWVPEGAASGTIDGPTIHNAAVALGILAGVVVALIQFSADIFIGAMLLFFLGPLIALTASVGESSLLLPKRAAYRMGLAVLVPLVVLGGALHAAGYPVTATLGGNGALMFWSLAGCAMGVWTGVMARQMFGPPRRPAPHHP
jgi:hypothetical protein